MATLWGQQLWGTSLWWGLGAPPPTGPEVLSIDVATISPQWLDDAIFNPVWTDTDVVATCALDSKTVIPFWVDSETVAAKWSDGSVVLATWGDNEIIRVCPDSTTVIASWGDSESVNPRWLDGQIDVPEWLDIARIDPEWLDTAVIGLARFTMTAFNNSLKPIVRGDTRKIERTFTGLPTGETITKAWLTVKTTPSVSDPGLFQVEITTSATSSGQITDASSSDGQIAMYFIISGTNSALATGGAEYIYDIQVKTSTDTIHTLVMGTVTFFDGVTAATS